MTQHKILRDKYIAVQVPVDSYEHLVCIAPTRLIFWVNSQHGYDSVILPKGGSYTFMFLTSTATKEDCRKVVEFVKTNSGTEFYDYENKRWLYTMAATESFISLLKSVGITDGVWAVLQKF